MGIFRMNPQKLLEQFLGPQGLAGLGGQQGGGQPGAGGGLSSGLGGALGGLSGMLGGLAGQQQGGGQSVARPGQAQTGGAQPAGNEAGGLGGALGALGGFGGGALGGLAAGGLLSVLIGNKKVRKLGGGLLSHGAAAAFGALAHKAFQNWREGQAASAAPPASAADVPAEGSPFLPAQTADGRPFALSLIKAMIAAANADGHIGPEEHRQIFEAANRAGFDAEAKAFVFDALANPPSIAQIAGMADSMEQAAELWLAARLAIDPDHPSEQAFLATLGQALNLPPDLVAHLDRQVSQN